MSRRLARTTALAAAAGACLLGGCASSQDAEPQAQAPVARPSLVAADGLGGSVFSQAIAMIDRGQVAPDGTTLVDAARPLDR